MLFLDQHEASLGPKCLFLGAILVAMIVAWWMMFPSTNSVPIWLEPYLLNGDFIRRSLVFFCLAVYVLRVTVTTLVFLKRKFIWGEAFIVTIFMTFVLLVFAWRGGANPNSVGLVEVAGLAFYFGGSYLSTVSEYQRQHFKSNPANKGELYTLGLFGLSRNINYFGDIVLFSGLARVTGRVTLLVIPLIRTLNFVFFIIPQKEAYLSEKYGSQFRDFSKQTRKLIPFIY